VNMRRVTDIRHAATMHGVNVLASCLFCTDKLM
jgi:hypothetical protein